MLKLNLKILVLALVAVVWGPRASEASFFDGFTAPDVNYTGSNSNGSGGSYTISGGKLRITTGADNTYSVMTSNVVRFNIGDTLSLDVPAISTNQSVFMMCSTSAFQPNGSTTFGFRFRRDGPGYARMELCPGGIFTPYPSDPIPGKPATLMVKRTSEIDFEYSIRIEGEVTGLGVFTLPQLSGNIDLHIGAQAYGLTSTTFAFDNLQVSRALNFTELTVLTYNTHLFEDSAVECLCRCGWWAGECVWEGMPGSQEGDYIYHDGTRRGLIASEVVASGADIVALEEVWSPDWQVYFATQVQATYPYAAYFFPTCDCRNAWPLELQVCVQFCSNAPDVWKYYTLGNGLVLLSKWPLSDVKFERFPVFSQEGDQGKLGTEAWADKGVLTATVNVNGAPIRIGISHALTGPDDYKGNWDTEYVGTVTFQFNGEAYIFSLNNNNGRAHIRRFEDYSYFDEAAQTQKHGAGWKQIYEGLWGFDYVAVVSFELNGHPYIFGLKGNNRGRVFRINDDPATGWTQVYEGPMSSTYVPVASFELDGHPYLFAVRDSNQGRILWINDDPCTGWSDVYEGALPLEYTAITSFELDSRPYLFAISNSNQGRILRINDDPCTGWSDVYDGNWPSGYDGITSFELDSHPYVFTYSDTNSQAYIYRINDDPCTGWSYVKDGDLVFSDYIAMKSFDMNGHPYLLAQRNCCDQLFDRPQCRHRPGEAYLKRINDDPNTGWEDLYQLEDIKMIRDATITEGGPPAIVTGDLNIHRGKYGIMNQLFRKAGAVDAYAQVADAAQDGNTCDYNNNLLNKYFSDRREGFDPENPDNVDRIDYIYVKQTGPGLNLVPIDAYVIRDWTLEWGWDLSDHYPLIATFRLETGCAAMKADFDCDRLVNIFDLAILCSVWLSEPNSAAWNPACDVSEPPDEIVNLKDYTELARQWQTMPVHNITQDKWYEAIQAAINDANNGEEIEAGPAYYYEAIDFKGKAITLRSADPNEPNIVAATVINGLGHYHVVKCVTGEDANTVLAGFTITGGNANGPTDGDKCGGGMYTYYSRPTVTNCKFISNKAGLHGGGVYNQCSNLASMDLHFLYCTFSSNTATNGGGMFNNNSHPAVVACTFSGNTADKGGGMDNYNSSPTVTNCTFNSNLAQMYGYGGGMYNYNSLPKVTNCIFNQNIAQQALGGGIANYNSSHSTVTNCTFSGNVAGGGAGIRNWDSSPVIKNCILWDNEPDEMASGGSSVPTVAYCDIQGGYSGTGNINADPCFVNAAAGNLCLSTPDSPCVDAGNNSALPADMADLDGDSNTVEPIPFDLAGNPRVLDGDANGTDVVDMGAYEYVPDGSASSSAANLHNCYILASHWLEALWPHLTNEAGLPVPAKPHLMIKHDLEQAGIPYKTAEGTAHFHAQRHNFATALSVSAANVKTAQDLLRHSDPRLTLSVYTHGVPEQQRAAIENLPDLSSRPSEQQQRKTGTDDESVFANCLANSLHKQDVLSRTGLVCSGQRPPVENTSPASENLVLAGISDYPRRESNPKPLAPEANALSN